MSGIWIKRTGQVWKLVVFYLLIVLTLLLFAAFVMAVNGVRLLDELGTTDLAFAFVGMGFTSLIWICLSVRCPRCGHKPVWNILRRSDVSAWLVTLYTLDRCPECRG